MSVSKCSTYDSPLPYQIIRRNGSVTAFNPEKIAVAIKKAFLAVEGDEAQASIRVQQTVNTLTEEVVFALTRDGLVRTFHIEAVQDHVEKALMRHEHHEVARAYILYREKRAEERAMRARKTGMLEHDVVLRVRKADGSLVPVDMQRLQEIVVESCDGLECVSPEPVMSEIKRNIFDGISIEELLLVPVLAARMFVEREPDYSYLSARLLLSNLRREACTCVFGKPLQPTQKEMTSLYSEYFTSYLFRGIESGLIDQELSRFDLEKISFALRPERDLSFQYLGLQTLYDRYFLHENGVRFELPQAFFMRIAMGLAIREIDREDKAVSFYETMSSFDFMPSTPTLFNCGTPRPQLSSCFLTTVPDDLDGIFSSIKDNALLAKYSGGIGNDWTSVRGLGARIKGTNGESQGIIPFLKVANDTAIAVNQGGKRKGAVCAYLETWHIDIEEFLELRKNTGDERRRTHDMHTANWVPDLFMERVEADGMWTLFSPDETPDLHGLFGSAFKAAYEDYEQRALQGELKIYKRMHAVDLWRRMLTMLFETGHPWITFKDPCNIRSPQQHVGTVHSSNLCTEITLNTSPSETAVCNLGSINLVNHVTSDGLDKEHLSNTVHQAVRMLDNVVDINLYTIHSARRSNLRHRPIGLGLMGFQDALHILRIPYDSDDAGKFADESMELISYDAISASADLSLERGRYPTFDGSLWSQGILPIDSLDSLATVRRRLEVDRSVRLNWDPLRKRVKEIGMRNSNVMAIAPTATIANICGVTPSIEPYYRNLFVKSNMSGEFTVLNAALVRDLKAIGVWDKVMISDLKYFDGVLTDISRIPAELRHLYATAFEIAPERYIILAALRQKWLDQAQSLNIYFSNPSGKKLDMLYRLAWATGLKTTYYLRTLAATHVEKATLCGTDGRLSSVPVPVVCAAVDSIDALEGVCGTCQ